MRPYLKILLIGLLIVLISSLFHARADVVTMNDGREIRGIVVEDYHDRLVLSTIDGEITLMKSDIKRLVYDSQEENLIKLGELATERGDYLRAFVYYDRAFKINPDSKKARDGIVYLQGYLVRKRDVLKEEDVKRRAEFEEFWAETTAEREEEKLEERIAQLRDTTGLILKPAVNKLKVEGVLARSPAYEAGIRKGDFIVAVWGRLTGYMKFADVLDMLLRQASIELKVTIERTVEVAISKDRSILAGPSKLIGASLSMEFDGLTVFDVRAGGASYLAGLEKGDLIVAIDGMATRYMPLKDAIGLIRGTKNKSVKLTIRRETTIWRKAIM